MVEHHDSPYEYLERSEGIEGIIEDVKDAPHWPAVDIIVCIVADVDFIIELADFHPKEGDIDKKQKATEDVVYDEPPVMSSRASTWSLEQLEEKPEDDGK